MDDNITNIHAELLLYGIMAFAPAEEPPELLIPTLEYAEYINAITNVDITERVEVGEATKEGDEPRSGRNSDNNWITATATTYVADCDGCIGITKTGVDVRNTTHHKGKRVIAVDPAVIPLGSTVELRYSDGRTEMATAEDVGGAIKGRKIDILRSSRDKAIEFGRQSVEVRVVE